MRRDWTMGPTLLGLTLFLTNPAFAQEESDLLKQIEELKRGQEEIQLQIKLMQEIEELRKGQDEIRKEIADIKRLLQQGAQARAAAPAAPDIRNLVVDIAENPFRGEVGAKLTLVEFTDYQ